MDSRTVVMEVETR